MEGPHVPGRTRIVTWSARILVGASTLAAANLAGAIAAASGSVTAGWVAAAAVVVVGAIRLRHLGLNLGPAGIQVVNVFGEHEVPWSQVREVRWEDGVGVTRGVPGWPARLRTARGSHRITATWAFYPGEKGRVLDELRRFTVPRGVPVDPGRVTGDRPPPPRHPDA